MGFRGTTPVSAFAKASAGLARQGPGASRTPHALANGRTRRPLPIRPPQAEGLQGRGSGVNFGGTSPRAPFSLRAPVSGGSLPAYSPLQHLCAVRLLWSLPHPVPWEQPPLGLSVAAGASRQHPLLSLQPCRRLLAGANPLPHLRRRPLRPDVQVNSAAEDIQRLRTHVGGVLRLRAAVLRPLEGVQRRVI